MGEEREGGGVASARCPRVKSPRYRGKTHSKTRGDWVRHKNGESRARWEPGRAEGGARESKRKMRPSARESVGRRSARGAADTLPGNISSPDSGDGYFQKDGYRR